MAFGSGGIGGGRDRCGECVQGGLYRQARTQMRLCRGRQQGAARVRLAARKPDDGGDGSLDAFKTVMAKAFAGQ